MRCHKCGFESPAAMNFCGKCGNALKKHCSNCGLDNPPDFKFCGRCAEFLSTGNEVGSESVPKVSPAGAGNNPLSGATNNSADNAASSASNNATNDAAEPQAQGRQLSETVAGFQSQHQAERRQLTVLFCDIVGSSAIAEIMDPEDLREIYREYRHVCSAVISHHLGYVAQYLGDGILAYFGYPTAQEDDARRAVAAALELQQRIKDLSKTIKQVNKINMSVRIGIHTGLVVVGEVGAGDKRSVALGGAPNLAARIQDQAQPGTILISSATYRLVSTAFECEDLGQFSLKGFSAPVQLYRPLQEFALVDQIERVGTCTSASIVGRDGELKLLNHGIQQAHRGQGQVVLVNGEPGMGKSSLINACKEMALGGDFRVFECWGRAYYQNSFMYPVIELLRRTFQIEGAQSDKEKLAKIESALMRYDFNLAEVVPLLADLLTINAVSGGYAELELSPLQKKQEIFATLLTLISELSKQKCVILVVEDLHWVDASTLEFLNFLIKNTAKARIFLLLSCRTEFKPTWDKQSHASLINLQPLNKNETTQLIESLAGDKKLPRELVKQICDKTDGTPYFIEEITKMVLESDMLTVNGQNYELVAPISSLSIPSTLRDSLMARIDCLGPKKELAQLSSTLGREFALDLLEAVSAWDEKKLQDDLSQLVVAELFDYRGQSSQSYYSFRHALIHEVAYRSLLKSTRQKYHKRIAGILQHRFSDMVTENPELLAHHCTEAGQLELALFQWLRAGKAALQRSANIEAVTHFSNGLDVLSRVKESDELLWLPQTGGEAQDRQQYIAGIELAFQSSLGLALMMSKGYAAMEVEKAYSRARELCRDVSDIATVFPILCGLWGFYLVRAELGTAHDLAKQLVSLSSLAAKSRFEDEAKRAMGSTLFWCGRLSEARTLLGEVGEKVSLENIENARLEQNYTQDTRVANMSEEACVLWLLGYPDQALEKAKQSLELADKMAHPFSQAYARNFVISIYQLRGESEKVLEQAREQITLSTTYEFMFWYPNAKMFEAQSLECMGLGNNNVRSFEEVITNYCSSGAELGMSYYRHMYIQLLFNDGRINKALAVCESAIADARQKGEGFFITELQRLQAMLYWRGFNQLEEAEKMYQNALASARGQGTLSIELRTAIDMSQLWRARGRSVAATELLKSTLVKFSEGYGTKDFQHAKQLLRQFEAVAPA